MKPAIRLEPPTFTDLPADLRTQRALSQLDPAPAWRRLWRQPKRSAVGHRHRWLYWLLRSRQPRQTLLAGRIDDTTLLVAAAAISGRRDARLICQIAEPAQAAKLRQRCIRAGLDWAVRFADPQSRTDTVEALLLRTAPEQFAPTMLQLSEGLAAGALVVGMPNEHAHAPAALEAALAALAGKDRRFEAGGAGDADSQLLIALYRGD